MIREIKYKVRIFEPGETSLGKKYSRRRVLWLLEALTQIDKIWLELHPETPALYDSNVKYAIEDGEIFRDIPSIIEDGEGDCDCLSCWRCAELQAVGINAHPYIKWRKEKGRWMYHVLVAHPGGKIEDPSLALGMGGGKIVRKPIFVQP